MTEGIRPIRTLISRCLLVDDRKLLLVFPTQTHQARLVWHRYVSLNELRRPSFNSQLHENVEYSKSKFYRSLARNQPLPQFYSGPRSENQSERSQIEKYADDDKK